MSSVPLLAGGDYEARLEANLERARTKIEELGRCRNCFFGTFDHGSGENTLEKCVPMDPNNHRYCPCERCDGTGIDPSVQRFLRSLES